VRPRPLWKTTPEITRVKQIKLSARKYFVTDSVPDKDRYPGEEKNFFSQEKPIVGSHLRPDRAAPRQVVITPPCPSGRWRRCGLPPLSAVVLYEGGNPFQEKCKYFVENIIVAVKIFYLSARIGNRAFRKTGKNTGFNAQTRTELVTGFPVLFS
jgi:hypothetical protein